MQNSVRNYLSAVRAWHIIHDVPWKGHHHLTYILNGVERMQPDGRPPQPSVTRDMLELLHIGLDNHIPENACILAAADTAFWTQSRLGELFAKNRSTFDLRRVPARSHLSPPSTLNGSRTLFYPYTKTKKYASDKSSVTWQLGKSNPIESLRIHLARNHAANDSPLFSFFTRTGDLVCLTK
ncbi:hypothetical protein BKA93DRAFT_826750 [Sparassis latifolia]